MPNNPPKLQLLFTLSIAVIAWAGVVLQYYLVIYTWEGLGISPLEGTLRFFSYFTILTNTFVALSLTIILLRPKSRIGNFFSRTDIQTALAVYIFVVGMVYNLILRKLWSPQGLQLIVDNILHSIVPFFYIIYWLVFIPKEKIRSSKAFSWLIYPAVYFVWILIFGSITKFYPYPFMDVNALGYAETLLHAGILLVAFLMLGFIAIIIKRSVGKKLPQV